MTTTDFESVRRALVGRYDVLRLQGRGGMATVYLAEDLQHGGEVAVKVLEPDLAGSVGHERFLREIRIASSLSHPGILTVKDSGEVDGLLYYVMPYVHGESLRERMDRERQLPIEEALSIATDVATALDAAHQQGFVHRDIKPENILLSDGRVLVADFGIARAVDQAGTEKLTETGLAVGTPTYMSPEQWTGDVVDGRSDLYALGCVTFEMLVGEPPFTGPTAQVVLARHSLQEVPSLRVARSTITAEVETAVRRAMAKVPADRFTTTSQFARALVTPLPPDAGLATATTGGTARAPNTGATGRRRVLGLAGLLGALVVVAVLAFVYVNRSPTSASPDRTRLVVLPFRNVGAADDEYFSDGITEEITSRLSSVASLGVIARTSAVQYRNTTKSVKEIGAELGVSHLIEGSVRWDRAARDTPGVRISIRLIRVSDATPVWSTDLTVDLEQVFEVQANVAERVVQALDMVLIEPERARLAARPTENLTAYDFYLRGNSYYNRSWERADVDSAIAMYERATQQDPTFALAWAQLGKTHAWTHRLGFDETPERLAQSRAAIAKAMEYGPDLPETHIAQGLYLYWGEWKFEEAVDALAKARAIQPSNAWVHLQLGNIRRRQGQWEQAVREYERAGEFDPRFHIIWFNIGHLYLHTRQYDQAEPFLDRAITLQPTFLDAYLLKLGLILGKTGDVARARQWFDSTESVVPPDRWRPLAGHWLTGPMRTLYPSPAERLGKIKDGLYGLEASTALLARAEALTELGATVAARATSDSATLALERLYTQSPTTAWVSCALGVSYARQGRKEDAIASVKRAESLMNDALDGPMWIQCEAYVQVLVGNRDEAMDALELLLKIPSGLSAQWLPIDPAWTPLQGDPRFERLADQGARAAAR